MIGVAVAGLQLFLFGRPPLITGHSLVEDNFSDWQIVKNIAVYWYSAVRP